MKNFLLTLCLATALPTAAQADDYNLGVDLTFPQPNFGPNEIPSTIDWPQATVMSQPTNPTFGFAPLINDGLELKGLIGVGKFNNTLVTGVVVDTPVGPYIGGAVRFPVYPETKVKEKRQQP